MTTIQLIAAGILAGSLTLALPNHAAAHGAGPAPVDHIDSLPLLSEVAPEAIQISPHVPDMGEHWAVPGNLPTGPVYCVIEGRVVCVEYILDASGFAAGKQWTDLSPNMVTPPVSRVDIEYKPDGIGEMTMPLYTMHLYFADKPLLAGK
jgi:hypothetical protein